MARHYVLAIFLPGAILMARAALVSISRWQDGKVGKGGWKRCASVNGGHTIAHVFQPVFRECMHRRVAGGHPFALSNPLPDNWLQRFEIFFRVIFGTENLPLSLPVRSVVRTVRDLRTATNGRFMRLQDSK